MRIIEEESNGKWNENETIAGFYAKLIRFSIYFTKKIQLNKSQLNNNKFRESILFCVFFFLLLLKFEDTFFLCIDDYGHEHFRYIYVHCKYIPREQKIDIFIYLFIFWIFLFLPWTTSKIYFHYVKIAEANVIQPNFIGSLANKSVCCACYTYVYGIHMRCRMKCYKRNGIVLVHAVERSHIKMWIEIQGMKCV